MRRPRRETVSEQCVDLLRAQILDRKLLPGTSITEEALAREMGVSRPTVREVLNTLTVEGLLTRNPSTRALQVTTLSHQQIREIYCARRLLEAGGATAFAARPDGALTALADETHRLVAAIADGDFRAVVRQDIRCHVETVALVGSADLTRFYGRLLSKLRLTMVDVSGSDDYDLKGLGDDHLRFLEHLRNRRIEEACEDVLERLNRAEKLLLSKTPVNPSVSNV